MAKAPAPLYIFIVWGTNNTMPTFQLQKKMSHRMNSIILDLKIPDL